MFWLQFLTLLLCIFIGARLGGVGLGVMGGVGMAILVFVFHLQPTAPPIDVMLMILAVITAAGALQAAGGMDYLVHLAEKALRKNPKRITFLLQLLLIYSHYVQVLVTLPILYFLLLQKSLVNQGLDRNAQCQLP
ncbi:Anaerobic C4-dicarboxylate transporter dcuB [Bacillus thuringiensis IBL 200]|nr:Anaerobic C4-dicarboxylate transporter dcuB [Bacillus thuringiensis IBL 200]